MNDPTATDQELPDMAGREELEKIFEDSQPKLAQEESPAPKPTRLSEVDRLKLENVSLKLMNIGHQFDRLTTERVQLSRKFDDLRRECLERYGVDVAVTRIDEEGNFVGALAPGPRGST